MKKKIYSLLPPMVKGVLVVSEGWLVGGAITDYLAGNVPKDYDIIIENPQKMMEAAILLTSSGFSGSINTFGGHKFVINDIEIDMWCESLGYFLYNASVCSHAYNLRKQILILNQGY